MIPYKLMVCGYPRGPVDEIVDELDSLGVNLLEEGKVVLNGRKVLGKGTRSIVVCCDFSGMRAAAKIRRADSPRSSQVHEARILTLANSVGVGPRLLAHTKNVLILELVEGIPLIEQSKLGDDELAEGVSDALQQAKKLDSIGVDHGELSRPGRHVYIKGGKAKLLDFDSASMNRRPHNFNSLYSALYVKPGPLRQRLSKIDSARSQAVP